MKPADISLIVLTKDEEQNLKKCLQSVEGLVSEIIIIDSGSTDGTEPIAREFGARFITHEFKNQADQFNWALAHAEPKGEWIMRLDADEELIPELKEEIANKLSGLPAEVNGVILRRRLYFLGRFIRHGGYYPTELLRIFRRGKGVSEEREMDEHLILLEGRSVKFENDFADDNRKDLGFWIAKHNGYAAREARAIIGGSAGEVQAAFGGSQAEQKRWLKENVYQNFPLFIRPFFYYIYRYLFRLGFLDGKEGLVFHFLQAFWYRFLVDARLFEMRRKRGKIS